MKLPEESVAPVAGDYLLHLDPETGWQIFVVVDLLQLQRLIPLADNPRHLMLEETLLDSTAPAYFEEPHLLLTLFDPVCPTEAEAREAIERAALTQRIENIVRPTRTFTEENSRLVRSTESR